MERSRDLQVTSVFLPPKEEVYALLDSVWESGWVTNQGPLLTELEKQIAERCGVENMQVVTSGTIGLQLAIHALDWSGEVLTTPFSYIATTSSILWQKCKPVFVDIDPYTFNVDPGLIVDALSSQTVGMLFTHVFGNPCDVSLINEISKNYNIPVIYDAAHAFGVELNGKSIFKEGDISIASFHATKVYHMIEGGGVFCEDEELFYKMKQARNFGHHGFGEFDGIGINGKNSEMHAAVGLIILKYSDYIISSRERISTKYNDLLSGSDLVKQKYHSGLTKFNYSYYPVLFPSNRTLIATIEFLNKNEIFPRRYFYPSLNELPYLDYVKMPVSEDIASRILCLPLSHDITDDQVIKVVDIVMKTNNKS